MEGDDVALPKATIKALVKEYLPKDMRCSAECLDMLMDCCLEFTQLLSSEANEAAAKDKKSTIQPDHVLRALQTLQFDDFLDEVKAAKEAYDKEVKGQHKLAGRKTKAELEGMTEDQQIEMQRQLFAAARARSMNLEHLAEANVQAALGLQQQSSADGAALFAAASDSAQQPLQPQEQPLRQQHSAPGHDLPLMQPQGAAAAGMQPVQAEPPEQPGFV